MVEKVTNYIVLFLFVISLLLFANKLSALNDRVSALEEQNVALTNAQEVFESEVSDTLDLTIQALNGLQETDVMMAELIEGKIVWMQSSKE